MTLMTKSKPLSVVDENLGQIRALYVHTPFYSINRVKPYIHMSASCVCSTVYQQLHTCQALVPQGMEKLHSIPEELFCLNKDNDRHSVVTDITRTGGERWTKLSGWVGSDLRVGSYWSVLLSAITKEHSEIIPDIFSILQKLLYQKANCWKGNKKIVNIFNKKQ